MSNRLKGFVFGALLMLMPPAFALQGDPAPLAVQEEPGTVQKSSLPYFQLSYEDAEEALGHALADRGAGSKVTATITNREGEVVFSYSQPISVEIRGLRFDANSRRFNANLVSVSGQEVLSAKAVTGRFDELVEVPMLKRSVRAGETISENDIELRDTLKSRARTDMITDIASLVGKTPERVISAGRPIRLNELAQPADIKKNDLVKMVYTQGAMAISTTGQAMSDARVGSLISVKNTASKKIVQATVQNANTVIVGNPDILQTSRLESGGLYDAN